MADHTTRTIGSKVWATYWSSPHLEALFSVEIVAIKAASTMRDAMNSHIRGLQHRLSLARTHEVAGSKDESAITVGHLEQVGETSITLELSSLVWNYDQAGAALNQTVGPQTLPLAAGLHQQRNTPDTTPTDLQHRTAQLAARLDEHRKQHHQPSNIRSTSKHSERLRLVVDVEIRIHHSGTKIRQRETVQQAHIESRRISSSESRTENPEVLESVVAGVLCSKDPCSCSRVQGLVILDGSDEASRGTVVELLVCGSLVEAFADGSWDEAEDLERRSKVRVRV